MAITCDWCGEGIRDNDKGRWGHATKMAAFDGVALSDSTPGRPRDVALSLHFHELCARAAAQAFYRAVADHEYTDGELDRFAGDGAATSEPTPERRAEVKRQMDDRDRAHARWDHLPQHEKERAVLEAVGEERLSNRQIRERLENAPDTEFVVWQEDLAELTRAMFKAGELEREQGQWGKSRVRYFRKTTLEGPIKDLNDALGES